MQCSLRLCICWYGKCHVQFACWLLLTGTAGHPSVSVLLFTVVTGGGLVCQWVWVTIPLSITASVHSLLSAHQMVASKLADSRIHRIVEWCLLIDKFIGWWHDDLCLHWLSNLIGDVDWIIVVDWLIRWLFISFIGWLVDCQTWFLIGGWSSFGLLDDDRHLDFCWIDLHLQNKQANTDDHMNWNEIIQIQMKYE